MSAVVQGRMHRRRREKGDIAQIVIRRKSSSLRQETTEMAKATALRKVSKPVPGKAVGSQMNGCETATCIFTLAFFLMVLH